MASTSASFDNDAGRATTSAANNRRSIGRSDTSVPSDRSARRGPSTRTIMTTTVPTRPPRDRPATAPRPACDRRR